MRTLFVSIALSALASAAGAQTPAYWSQGNGGGQVMNPYGMCCRSGSWTPDQMAEPCDSVPRAEVPAAPVARAPEPAPVAAPQPRAPERIQLSADVLFDFNSAKLKPEGMRQLDELAGRISVAEQITITGHTDRLGGERYNQKLSEARAMAVRDYLQAEGTNAIQVAGKGKAEPITGERCKGMPMGRKLIDCLQPDRRVDLEVSGTRAMAGEPSMLKTRGSSSEGSSGMFKSR